MVSRLRPLFFACLLTLSFYSNGQTVHGNPEVWFLVLNNFDLNDRWRIGNELHLRRNGWLEDQKQFIIRPYVELRLTDAILPMVGYSYIETAPHGDFPLPTDKPEHNFWEQVTVQQKLPKATITHRYRLEHRYQGKIAVDEQGNAAINGFSFSHRFRYRLIYKHPLGKNGFVLLFDELWINIPDGLRSSDFDRNWVYAALGRNFGKGTSGQIAYLYQWTRSSAELYESNHGVQFTFQYDLKLKS